MVPEKQYEALANKPPVLALPSSHSPISSLQTALQDLNSKSHLTDDARWREYEKIFNSYFAYTRKRPTPVMSSEIDIQSPEEEMNDVLKPLFVDFRSIGRLIPPIIKTLPTSLRQKGDHLLTFLAQTSDVLNGSFQVTRTGHISISGHEIPGSNLLDLIHYAVRPKRKVKEPQGWSTFLHFLHQHNVPRELLAKHFIMGTPLLQMKTNSDENEGLQTDEDDEEDFQDAGDWKQAAEEKKTRLPPPPQHHTRRDPHLVPATDTDRNLRSRMKHQKGKGIHNKKTTHQCCWSVFM